MKKLLPGFALLILAVSTLWAAPPVVKTVPWVGANPLIPHDTWSGNAVTLKGTSDSQSGGGVTIEYVWDFGDGSPVVTGSVVNKNAIEATHAYTGAVNTVFTARLTLRNSTTGETASQPYYVAIREKTPKVEVNVAIDEGLWYLWKTAGRYAGGQFAWNNVYYGNHYGNTTASAVQAYQVHGHRQGQGSNPYAEAIAGGIDYLTANLTVQAMSLQAGENPDSNGNGIGLSWPSDHPIYETGAVMDALVATGTPGETARTGNASVVGRTYKDLVQDMVDMYAWGQGDTSWFLGGWRYSWNWDSDNSAAQWGAIGMIAAERVFGCTVPGWVKTRNRAWLEYSYNPGGWFGYQGPGAIRELSTGPCGMVQLSFAGLDDSNPKWVACVNYLRSNWATFISQGRDARYYSYYAFAKAMRTALPEPIVELPGAGALPALDWYLDDTQGLARILVDRQRPDGSWTYDGWPYVGEQTAAAWNLIILSDTLFEAGTPVAVAKANPNPAVAGQMISLDGTDSFHQDPFKAIASWEWDLDLDGTFDASGPFANVSFASVGDYPVKLRVLDDGSTPKSAETILIVRVTTPPVPPTAHAGGPYVFCPEVALWFLDATRSSNPDDGLAEPGLPGDRIIEYAWELNGDNGFDDAFGATPDVSAYFRGLPLGSYVVQVRTTDNTAESFPSSGLPNQTSVASSVVVLQETCICVDDLVARPKVNKIQLTWSHSGAAQYHIFRGTVAGGPYARVGTTASTYSTWLDEGVRFGGTYYYVVRPADELGREICQSNEASARLVPRGSTTENKPPVANAGSGQTAAVGQVVTLDGSKSSDPNGDPLTFLWSFSSRPEGSTAVLSSLTAVKPTFEIDLPGNYVVQLVVNDGKINSLPSAVTISTLNTPPLADAGPDQSVVVGLLVNLDGSGSSDVDGDPLSFTWSFESRPDGSAAVLSSATAVKPTFTVDKAGTYRLRLIVNDGQADSAPAVVTISTVNSAPVADAGPDQTAFLLQTVTLDGSGSSDADGDPLTYEWSFTSRPPGSAATLSSSTAIQPTFVVDAHGEYVVQLVVNDGTLNSVPVDTVTISTTNSPPAANAGPDQSATVGQVVTLDGSASSDVDGNALTFKWSLTVPGGSAAALSNTSAVAPTFRLDRPGTYVAQLIVNDGLADSAADTVAVTTLNSAPVADAGPHATINVPSIITLDGTGSFDVDGDPLNFFWSMTTVPPGSSAALSSNFAVKPTLTLDLAGTYVAQLVVDDGTVDSAASSVTFTTLNTPPLAHAGLDQSATVGQLVTLDATDSSDVNGDLLDFFWSLVSRPPGSTAALSEVTAPQPQFTLDLAGEYIFQLIVNDGSVDSLPDAVRISTLNIQPLADAGADQSVTPGAQVALDGSTSTDADGDPLLFRWALTARPDGSAAALTNPTATAPTFIADLPGTYVAQLVVNDGAVDSAPDTVTVSTINSAPVADAGSDQTVIEGQTIELDGSASSDADGDSLSYRWALLLKPEGSLAVLSEPATATPSFLADVAGTYVAQLIVNDGTEHSHPATTTLGATPQNVVVPNVVGLEQEAGEAALVSAGLTVGVVSTATSATVPAGDIISQNPAAGITVPVGSPVNLEVSLGPPPVVVPGVVGLTEAAASAAIIAAQLTVGTIDTANHPRVPAGTIISQSPSAGTSVPQGTAVAFTVSLGPPPVPVPSVVGLTEAAASAAIIAAQLTVGTIDTANHPTVPAGTVLSQSPAAGALVAPGTAVAFTVSLGPPPVLVPNVVGLTEAAASAAILAAQLTVGTIDTANHPTVPAGTVISQSPAAGASTAPGSPVSLVVSLGPSTSQGELRLTLSQTVIGGGSSIVITPAVFDSGGEVVEPTPAISFVIVAEEDASLGPVPSVSGNQITTGADTRGVFSVHGTVVGTGTIGTADFTVIQNGTTSKNAGKFSALSLAESTASGKLNELVAALESGETAAIPAINTALKAVRDGIDLNDHRRSTAVAADIGFLPSTAQLTAAGFPQTPDDVAFGNLLAALKIKLEEITDFYNELDPASEEDDEATLEQLNEDLADLAAQLEALEVTVHGVIRHAPRLNGLLAVTFPVHLHAMVNRVDATLVDEGLAMNGVGDPRRFYEEGAAGTDPALWAAAGPGSMYGSTQPAFFGLLGMFSGVSVQMNLVNRIYGPFMEEVTRSIILLAINGLLQEYSNATSLEGIITGASQSFHVYGLGNSEIEVHGVNSTDPTRSDVYLIGSNAVAAVQDLIGTFTSAEIENIDDLFEFFDSVVEAVENAGQAAEDANQIADRASLGCILDAGDGPRCVQLIYNDGFESVSTGRFPQPVIILVHDMDASTGGWAFGIFNFIP